MPRLLFLFCLFLFLYLLIFVIEVCYQLNFHKIRNPSLYRNTLLCMESPPKTRPYTEHGYHLALQKKIVITGLCRNAEAYIDKNLQIARMIGSYFKDYCIVIYENDSKDNTRKILETQASQDPKLIVLGQDIGIDDMYTIGSLHSNRFQKMTYFRNKYLAYIRDHLPDYDYMMVIDFDIHGSTDINGIMNSIGREIPWGAIGTSGKMNLYGTFGLLLFNYDLLAVRFHNVQYDNHHFKTTLYNSLYQEYHRLFYNDLEPVRSTFHGIVLYKLSEIPPDAWYTTEYGCEHIGLNYQIKNIYINPYWKTYVGTQGPSWFFFLYNKHYQS